MDKKRETKEISKIKFDVETITTTPEDGFVSKKVITPISMDNYGKYHKGYSTTKIYSTNNPKISRLFTYSMCGIFFTLGLIFIYFGILPFLGIYIAVFFINCFFSI